MPCNISSEHLLKVPKLARKKKHRRRLSLPADANKSECQRGYFQEYGALKKKKDVRSRSVSGSYEKIHYCKDEKGLQKTVHEIFIPGFGYEGLLSDSLESNQDDKRKQSRYQGYAL